MKTLLQFFFLLLSIELQAQSGFERWYGNSWEMQEARVVLITADSNYILTGTSHIATPPCPNGCFGSAFLMKVDQQGDTIFTKSFAYSSHGNSLIATLDGGYAVAGGVNTGNYLVKTNAAGDTAWTKIYNNNFSGYHLAQSPDSGFFLAGSSLLKVSSTGDSLWAKPLGSAYSLLIASAISSSDSGLFISARSTVTSMRDVLKINSAGDTVWTKMFSLATAKL
jgi:hypothetical protein